MGLEKMLYLGEPILEPAKIPPEGFEPPTL
jgi:hypothetical protein